MVTRGAEVRTRSPCPALPSTEAPHCLAPTRKSLVGRLPRDDPPGFVPRPVTAVAGQKVTVNPSIEPVSNL